MCKSILGQLPAIEAQPRSGMCLPKEEVVEGSEEFMRCIMLDLGQSILDGNLTVRSAYAQISNLLPEDREASQSTTSARDRRNGFVRRAVKAIVDGSVHKNGDQILPRAKALALLDRVGDKSGEAMSLREAAWRLAPQQWQRRESTARDGQMRTLLASLQARSEDSVDTKAYLKNADTFDRLQAAFSVNHNAFFAGLGMIAGIGMPAYLVCVGITAVPLGVGLMLSAGIFVNIPAVFVGLHMAWHLWSPWGGTG